MAEIGKLVYKFLTLISIFMQTDIKVVIFWLAFVAVTWVLAKIHYMITNTGLRWKYFLEDYSNFGLAHCLSLYLGRWAIAGYIVGKIAVWWFKIDI